MASPRKIFKYVGIGVGVLFLSIQIFQVDHTNPAVRGEPNWDSPRTRELAKKACFDCHSNETNWPWYSYVAPVSWRVYNHVYNGRRHFNFSDYPLGTKEPEEAIEVIQKGEMPLSDYLILHAEADLTIMEKAELIKGLQKTFSNTPTPGAQEFKEMKDSSKIENGRDKLEKAEGEKY
ncbi:MAG: heme-binding domain-containing protein [Ignavibacteriales bacterium]|nr:heme-binding domain-containing protein [Ignavibacteriales bacterium]